MQYNPLVEWQRKTPSCCQIEAAREGRETRTDLVYHITFRMPAFIARISVYFNELLQNRAVTPYTFCCETCRIVEVAIHVIPVLII